MKKGTKKLSIHQATAADAHTVAEIYLTARATALPNVRWAHDAASVRGWIEHILIPSNTVHIAKSDKTTAGFIAVSNAEVHQLYLHPTHWRQGIGTALLNHAKSLSPEGLELWCFQCNPARKFYERHGFTETLRTNGQDNEEQEPDIRYAWRPTLPSITGR